jgi:hypothetical protein
MTGDENPGDRREKTTEECRMIRKRRLEASQDPDNSERFVIQKESNV